VKACKISKDSIWPAIQALEDRGLLVRTKGFRHVNVYVLKYPVGGKDGVTKPFESAEKEGCQSAESKGLHSAEKTGRPVGGKDGSERYTSESIPTKVNQDGVEKPAPVYFPWSSWTDVDQTTRETLEARFDSEWLHQIFPAIRGRKIKYKDTHVLRDWCDVLVAEVDTEKTTWQRIHKTSYDPKPTQKAREWSNDPALHYVTDIAEDQGPDGWQDAIKDSVYGAGQVHEVKTWNELPQHAKDVALRELKAKDGAP
jgi:hypothetical protein